VYGLATITGPTEEPVTLARAKQHLRVDHSAEDDLIQDWIAAAREMSEQYTGRRWVSQQLRMTLADWPDGSGEGWVERYIARTTGWPGGDSGMVPLPVEPVVSIDAVKYYATAGNLVTLTAGTDYQTWLDHRPPLLAPAPLSVWPTVQTDRLAAVQIEFTAGYGAPAQVPYRAKTAMLLCLGYWYENRGDGMDPTAWASLPQTLGMPPGAMRLLDSMQAKGYR